MKNHAALLSIYAFALTTNGFLSTNEVLCSVNSISLPSLAQASKAQLPSELIVEYYDKERRIKSAKYYLVNNKKHGMYLGYYRDGIVKEQTNYVNGIKSGKSTEYDGSGNISTQTDYLKGAMARYVNYCSGSNEICSETRMDGNNVSYYLVRKFMRLEGGSLPFLGTKGVAVNGRISGSVALPTQQGPVPTDAAGIGGIAMVTAIEPEAFKKIIELKREFEVAHKDETCCGFVMVINYSDASITKDKSAIYYERYVFNPLIGKINYIDYYKESGHAYAKVGHQVVD